MFLQDLIRALMTLDVEFHVLAPANTDRSLEFPFPIHYSRSNSSVVNGVRKPRSHVKRYQDVAELDGLYNYDLIIENNNVTSMAVLNHGAWLQKTVVINHTNYLPMRTEIATCYLVAALRHYFGTRTYAVSQEVADAFNNFPSHKAPIILNITEDEWNKVGERFDGTFCIHYIKNPDYVPVPNPRKPRAVVIARNVHYRRLNRNLKLARDYGYHLTVFTDTDKGLKYNPSYGNVKINYPHHEIMSSLPEFSFAVSTSTKETSGVSNFEYASYGLPVIHESPCSSEFLEPIGANYFGYHNLENVIDIVESHDYNRTIKRIRHQFSFDNFVRRVRNQLLYGLEI